MSSDFSIYLKTSSNWSGLSEKIVTTTQIPQAERAGHLHRCFANTLTTRHLCLVQGVTAASSHYCRITVVTELGEAKLLCPFLAP